MGSTFFKTWNTLMMLYLPIKNHQHQKQKNKKPQNSLHLQIFQFSKFWFLGFFFHNKMPQRFICWLYIKNYFDSCTETISVRDQISISLNILASNSLSLYKTKVLYCDDVHNIYLGHFQSKGWNRCMDIV